MMVNNGCTLLLGGRTCASTGNCMVSEFYEVGHGEDEDHLLVDWDWYAINRFHNTMMFANKFIL